MNDFGMIKDVLESTLKSNKELIGLGSALIGFLVINIITALINIFLQFKLKNKDKDIIKYEILENQRISILSQLYLKLEDLTYYDGTDSSNYLNKSNEINKFLSKNKIYLNKKIITSVNNYNDYFLSVLSDYRLKNYNKENELLNDYIKLFNE
ncbi:hypothetical protein ACTS9C_05525 [Empedobacter brevis]|uniref:hypothetical protein n=1 Tax=Empedobacter brevis TaxID=247 RepID=UPI00333EE0D4